MSKEVKSAKPTGKKYWQSLAELSDNKDIQAVVAKDKNESNGFSRREFLNLMGASLALAGLAGCRRPVEKIIPYVVAPEEVIPGIPNYYATSFQNGFDALGLIIENHEGRPTKIEGNKKHPSTLGKTDAFTQAEILNLYDPDRSTAVLKNGSPATLQDFYSTWNELYNSYVSNEGDGLVVVSEASTAPTFARLKNEFHRTFPKAKWVIYNPVNEENILNGVKQATGKYAIPYYNFEKAQVILSIDSDFLFHESGSIRNSMGFANGRRVKSQNDTMNRLYIAESSMSVTGGMADHRIIVKNDQIADFTIAVGKELVKQGVKIDGVDQLHINTLFDDKFIKELVADLIANRGASLVTVGRNQPDNIHALAQTINDTLGNIGNTISYTELAENLVPNSEELDEVNASTIIMIGTNPVYSATSSSKIRNIIESAEHSIQLSSHVDETAQLVEWHINQSHFLEEWNDTQSVDGHIGITQPQILPLFNGISNIEMIGLINTGEFTKGYDLVQSTWKNIIGGDFQTNWNMTLHDGIYSEQIQTPHKLTANRFRINGSFDAEQNNGLILELKPSAYTFDGKYSNNGWMQELPNPVTKLTWDNAALMSHRTAKRLNIKNEDVIKIASGNEYVLLPVWIMPGQADDTITVELGYGRSSIGRIGNNVGQNAYKLMNSVNNFLLTDIKVTKLGTTYSLACTQDNHGMNDNKLADNAIQDRLQNIIREASLDEYQNHPDFVEHAVHHPPLKSMWDEFEYDESPQWGMTIDLNVCTGCNACSTACQSENNIPIVGKREVRMGREMHWIRLDRYFTGDPDNPEVALQPVACQHCEMAPCEQVCPVAATTHSEDGMNSMTYNRCVGTRYCANNCPYKVRRFNYFNFTKDMPEIVQMARNPDVTVRFRGVIEKCSYCVQRVNVAKINAKNEQREIHDGEVLSACQQVCPTDAITFGNILDPDSKVSKERENNRNYALLGELNTKPRTLYQAKLRNPNPNLVEEHS